MNTRSTFHLLRIFMLTIALWLTGPDATFSQEYLFDTEIINVEDGLPHRMNYYTVEDKEGFIWINTQGAISRYDGYGFKTYNASFLGIGENKPAEIAIDHANRLWYHAYDPLGSVSGVIDTAKDSVYSIAELSGGLFNAEDVIALGNITPDNDEIFIATRSGAIYTYDGDFEKICHWSFSDTKRTYLQLRKVDADSSYWIVYGKELFMARDKKIVKSIYSDSDIIGIVSIDPDLMVHVVDSVMQLRTLKNDTLVPLSILPDSPDTMSKLLRLHQDYIYYATEDALMVSDKKGKLLYRFDEFDPLGDIHDFMSVVTLTDRHNILWINTQNGLIKFTAKQNPFKTVLPGSSVRGIFRDKDILWIGGGSYTGAVPDTIRTEQAFLDPMLYDAMSFYKDLDGHLWIGTQDNKIVEYIPDQNRYLYYSFDLTESYLLHLPFQNPVTGNYFIGTTKGLFRFDKKNKNVTPFSLPEASQNLAIRQAYQNAQGIWLASSKGIFLMDAQQEVVLKHYTTADGLPTNSIRHIHEDKQGIFWLGTVDAGLVRWDRAANSFRQYTREDELSNNKIYAVYEDDFETLWLPSDYGLMAFDKNTATTRVYLPKDGIAHEEFNRFSHFQDADGTLYFGGLNGVTVFHPAALRKNNGFEAPLYTTRVRVLEKDAETFTDRTDMFKADEKIILSPNDRILELELTLLDYEKASENQYAYKLSGKQEQWIYTRENKLSIINPPYGKYDLVIKARGSSGRWSEHQLIIPMHVKTPFYLQWWFILLSVIIITGGVFSAVRWRIQKLRNDRQRLEAEVQKRTHKIEAQAEALKALDKAKTRFFANITHEFRTPLTLVAGPVEQMIATLPPPTTIKKNLSGVLKNTRNLMGLINQLLDLSKLEGGRMKTEVSHGDIVRYTKELVQQFQPLADKKQLHLEFQADAGTWKIHIDSDKWNKIVHNLLSNAIKFTDKGGSIHVLLKHWQQDGTEYLRLIIKDTGIGIAAENLEHIFDRFYQADASSTRLQGGTGIGLSLVKELVALQKGSVSVESTIGKGSTFTVILPLIAIPDIKNIPPLLNPKTIVLPVNDEEIQPENSPAFNTKNTEEKKQGKLELLIIEDNDGMRDYIRSCIDASVYHISEAENGEEGIVKALEIVPDLIISDVMMPKKNGFEVTRAIRSHLATSHIPLILLTAKASLESRLEGLKRGADAYLTKPFSPQELVLRIKKLIELRQLLQKRYQNQSAPPDYDETFQQEDRFVSELRDYITENISNPNLGSEAVTDYFAISRTQLYRKLKALANTTISDYIRSVRLHRAMQLLKEKELNVSEIAYETGFSSPEHFSKTFKKAYGKNPSKW